MNKWPEVGTGHCACVFQRKEEFGDAECIEPCAYHANMEQQRDELLAACETTLLENLHLADGDDCTLLALKRAYENVSGKSLFDNEGGAA